jgi:tetratricopeptide (TPR) repeat protein
MARLRSPRTLLPLKLFVIFLLAFPLSVLASDGQQANAPSPIPDPNASAKDLEERGDVLRAQKRYLDALDFYAAAIAKHPTALLWNKEGMSYLFLQKYPEATKCFSRAIKAEKNAPEGYNNRGYMEQRNQNFNKAIRYYKKALALQPNDAVFHYNLGSSYWGKHQYDLAAQQYHAAYALDPDIFNRVSRIGVMAQAGSPEDRAAFSFMVARLYAQAGDVDHSLEYLRKAMEEGYKNIKKVYTDSEFATLRTDKRFEELMSQKPLPLP